jgi:hypothetical protein
MKASVIAFLLLWGTSVSWALAQTAPTERYAILTITQKKLDSQKLKVTLEYATKETPLQAVNGQVIDDDGSSPSMTSKVEVLNFMGKKGWRLQSVLLVNNQGPFVYQFVFVRND